MVEFAEKFALLDCPGVNLGAALSATAGVPVKYKVPLAEQEDFLRLRKEVVGLVQGGVLSKTDTPQAVIVLGLEASEGALCSGFLGSRRVAFEARQDELFGSGKWSFKHQILGRLVPREAAYEHYFRAYQNNLVKPLAQMLTQDELDGLVKAYGKIIYTTTALEWLTSNFRDVYDTHAENVNSGVSFTEQESPKFGHHIHDIALRKAVAFLGANFRGETLLQVRGPKSLGFFLSPGRQKFHDPSLIDFGIKFSKSWWEPGSIEHFYQSTRRLVVGEFRDDNLVPSGIDQAQTRSSYFDRVAARFVLRMLPTITKPRVELGQLNNLPWSLDSACFPLANNGLPREFSKFEIAKIVSAAATQLSFLFKDEGDASRDKQPLEKWSFKSSVSFVDAVKQWATGEPIDQILLDNYPELSEVRYWCDALGKFWKETIDLNLKPLFLARDAWVIMEYFVYRKNLIGEDPTTVKQAAYIPGSPDSKSPKNRRCECLQLDDFVKELKETVMVLNRTAQLEGREVTVIEVKDAFKRIFETSWALVTHGADSQDANLWHSWFESFTEIRGQFANNLEGVVVVDSDGTGKSALFIAAMLEFFSCRIGQSFEIDSLVGSTQMGDTRTRTGVADLSKKYDLPIEPRSGHAMPDVRWPFVFAGFDPNPQFNVIKNPSKYLALLWRSLVFYNQAVNDTYMQSE